MINIMIAMHSGHAEGQEIAEQMSFGHRAADHDGDAEQGDETGGERGPCFRHAEPQPTEAGSEERCHGEDHGDIGHRRVAEGIDVEDRGGGRAHGRQRGQDDRSLEWRPTCCAALGAMTHRIIRPANSPRQNSIVQASRWIRRVKKPAEL